MDVCDIDPVGHITHKNECGIQENHEPDKGRLVEQVELVWTGFFHEGDV